MNIIYIFLIYFISRANKCDKERNKIISRNYKNVLSISNAPLISSKLLNYFQSGNNNSSPFRNNPYYITYSGSIGYVACIFGEQIIIDLIQHYELNILKLRLWDLDTRAYNLIIYAINNNQQTVIFDSTSIQSIITVKFPTQFVSQFKFYNRNGNNLNTHLHIVKMIAAYQLN